MSDNKNKLIASEINKSDAAEPEMAIVSNIGKTRGSKSKIPTVLAEEGESSLVDIMYDKINEVLGGDNPNQYFCMTFPGTILSPHTFCYDYQNNQPKPPTVEASESRLANKLFDPCHITGGDNGRSLAQQYSTALDMLTPKMNAKIQEAKSNLRNMLITPYPYDFGNGMDTSLTLQQVFFRLYDDWVKLKMEWSKLQSDKKAELAKKYGTGSAEDNAAQQNEYLTWYQTIAEGYIEGLNEQYSKILAVFSPNDMKIIEGILDSGSGAELEEARETLQNVRKSNPNGGYIYPVSLTPENWFELLDNSFTGIDLLDSPEVLSQKMFLLSNQRLTLVAQENSITEAIPDDVEIKSKKEAVNKARENLDTAESNLCKDYGEGMISVLHAALDIKEIVGGNGVPTAILERLLAENGYKDYDKTTEKNPLSDLVTQIVTAKESQKAFIETSQQLSDAQMAYIESQNMQALKDILTPIRTQIEQLDLEISNLGAKIKLSNALLGDKPDSGSQSDDDTDTNVEVKESIAPKKVPKGFMQVVFQESASTMKKDTTKSASSSSSTSGANFFFCGGSSSESNSNSVFSSYADDAKCTVEIGMSVAKVDIERDWFNPGLFMLTGDMYNVTSQKIAPNNVSKSEFDVDRLQKMAGCVFPCFPTAFVVARDVTVRLTTEKAVSSETAMAMEQHAAKGGGFLFFSGSKSSSSSSSASCAHVSSKSNSTTIRFTDPQIIGYYIEATPSDNSTALDDPLASDSENVTIIDFVKKCKELLLQHRNEVLG